MLEVNNFEVEVGLKDGDLIDFWRKSSEQIIFMFGVFANKVIG